MKKHTMVTVAMMVTIFAIGAMAQTRTASFDSRVESGKRNYIMALRSGNQGLMESATMQVAKLRMIAPTTRLEDVKNIIDSLAVYGDTPSIRYKAYLAGTVFENPTWFSKKAYSGYQDHDEFFAAVSAQLQEKVLGSRAN
jgi:hypothetical protein